MDIKEYIDSHKQEMIQDLQDWVNIPSLMDMDDAGEGHPFGRPVNDALDWILKKAEDFGFRTRNVNGYAGEIDAGSGDRIIGIMGHGDVVAPGDGWDRPPFESSCDGERIWGRGSSDDKGPVLSSLYAMDYLSSNGLIPQDVTLRLIVGMDEEESWRCIEYYKAHTDRLPDQTIVPDGYFPLIYCEKGLVDFDMDFPAVRSPAPLRVLSLTGGTGRNIVAGKASCELEAADGSAAEIAAAAVKETALPDGFQISCQTAGNRITISVQGHSTHASTPEKGLNAISALICLLNSLPADTDLSGFTSAYSKYIGMDYDGKHLGLKCEDRLSGSLTFNIGTIELAGDVIRIRANTRYPATLDKEEFLKKLDNCLANAGFQFSLYEYLPPVYIDPESDFVHKLMNVYVQDTGDKEHEPFAIGGATYARGLPNAVCFGALFPWEEETAHEANECLFLDSYWKMTEIYAHGLQALMEG